MNSPLPKWTPRLAQLSLSTFHKDPPVTPMPPAGRHPYRSRARGSSQSPGSPTYTLPSHRWYPAIHTCRLARPDRAVLMDTHRGADSHYYFGMGGYPSPGPAQTPR